MPLLVKNSIRLKLVVMIGVLALLSAGAFALVVEQLGQSQALRHADQFQRHLATRMSSQLSRDLGARAAELRFLASMDRLRDPERAAQDKLAILQELKATFPVYSWLGITDATGTILASTESKLVGVNVRHRSWYSEGSKGIHFEDVHEAQLLAKHLPPPQWDEAPLRLLDISIPLHNPKGQFIGVLAAHLSLDWVYATRHQLVSELDGNTFDLVVVNREDQVMMGAQDQIPLHADLAPLFALQQARKGQLYSGVETWPDGRRYLTTATPVRAQNDFPGLGWTVVVRSAEAQALSSAAPLRMAALMGGLAGALVFSLPLWWMVNRQLIPLEQINAAAQRLSLNPDAPNLPVPQGSGEVAMFARTLTTLFNELKHARARYQILFQHAPVAMAYVDPTGRLRNTNERFEQMFGYSGQNIQSVDDWFLQCFPDDRRRVQARAQWERALSKVGSDGVNIPSGEYTVRSGRGEERILAIEGIAMQDGLLLAFQDLTDRRRAEEGLHQWAQAFQQSAIGIVIVDARRNVIISANPEFARRRGYTSEELVDFPVINLYTEDERPAARKIGEVLARAEHGIFETRHITRDGQGFPVLLDITVLTDADGNPTTRVGYAQDLTDRKRAEAEVMRLNAELEQRVQERTAELTGANKELDSFAYTVSHDLRAPLRTINGFAQLLDTEFSAQLGDEGRDYVNRIRIGTRKMAELIEGLLALSNFSRSVLERKSIDITAMAERRLAELAAAEPERQIDAAVEPGLGVTGDPRMVEALLTNLLDNAWKYTGKTEAARIRVYRGQVGGVDGICVSDNGAGFDMAKAGRLFEPFERLHLSSQFQGTGVGLATVKRIIDRHGGHIAVEAEPGQGASFCFNLRPDSESTSRY